MPVSTVLICIYPRKSFVLYLDYIVQYVNSHFYNFLSLSTVPIKKLLSKILQWLVNVYDGFPDGIDFYPLLFLVMEEGFFPIPDSESQCWQGIEISPT